MSLFVFFAVELGLLMCADPIHQLRYVMTEQIWVAGEGYGDGWMGHARYSFSPITS